MKMDELLPTILAAAGTTAEFCGQPHIWPLYEEWLHEVCTDGEPDGDVTREFMSVTATVILLLAQGLEREMIADRFSDLLSEDLLEEDLGA
jgi:hypothetical protein